MAARVVVSFEGAIVTEVELSGPVTVIGRHPDCDITIDHPAVSLRHALFRVVDRTVYLEDLASTNGTLVNGIVASNQVLHHLDLIQIGAHKLHFFDDSLLAGSVQDLERTVLTDYERTMLVRSFTGELGATPPSREPAAAEPVAAPPRREPVASDDGLSRTMAIPRSDDFAAGAVAAREEAVETGKLALRAIDGAQAGELIVLERANTMVRTAGGDSALLIRRGGTFFVARMGGHGPMRLNFREIGPGTHPIEEHDRIEVGGESFEMIRIGEASPGNTGN